jgi:hypothetical protein
MAAPDSPPSPSPQRLRTMPLSHSRPQRTDCQGKRFGSVREIDCPPTSSQLFVCWYGIRE